MSKNLLLILCLLVLAFSVKAQVQLDKSIQLTGTGADAMITGIDSVGASAKDAVNVKSIQEGKLIYALSGGSFGSYDVALSPAVTTLTTGMVIHFKANHANPGAASLNVNGLGAVSILKNYTANLDANDIKGGQIITVIYDGSVFQMQSQLGNSSGGGGGGFTLGPCTSFNTDYTIRGDGSGTWECTDALQVSAGSFGTVAVGGSPSSSYDLRVYGNVGIGTSSPSSGYELSVAGEGHFTGYVGINTTPSSSYDLRVNGNVGIGSSPSSSFPLSVNGNAHVSSGLSVGTTSSASSGYVRANTTFIMGSSSTATGSVLVRNSSGEIRVQSSTINVKENVTDLEVDARKVFALRPVRYNLKPALGGDAESGLIAEEVAEVVPELVIWGPERQWVDNSGIPARDENDNEIMDESKIVPWTVSYERLAVYLLPIVRDQDAEINRLKYETTAQSDVINQQGEELALLKAEMAGLRSAVNQLQKDNGVKTASIE